MNKHVEIARQEQGAWRLSLRDCLANELLSRIENLIQQELPGLRNIQNPEYSIVFSAQVQTQEEHLIYFEHLDY